MNLNLIWNIVAVILGALAVYNAVLHCSEYPMISLVCAFMSGIIVSFSAKFDMSLAKEKLHGTKK
jgi:EamA domain-containing membrane protein RarD